LRFTEGKPAKILAGVDRAVTRTTLFVQDKLGVSKDYREIEQGDFRFEVHPRYTGRHVDRIFPDGKKSSANEGDIIHVYQKGEGNEREQLIERKRVKDNPQGFSKPQR
jgi:hypothetical protein